MKKTLKILGVAGFMVVLFSVVVMIAFYHLIQVGEFRRFLVEQIEQASELEVRLGDARVEVGRVLGVSFRDFALREPGSARPAVTSERITARVALLPLLRRRLTFYEVRLSRPAVRLVRDHDGRIPLLDRLIGLPFLKEQEAALNLDLRVIKIENGEILFEDHRGEAGPVITRFRRIDLDLKRLRGTELSDFAAPELLKIAGFKEHGTALSFSLKSIVEKSGKQTALKSNGRVVFPQDSLELRKAWWKADTQLAGLPAQAVVEYAGGRLPVKSMTGDLTSRLRWEGELGRRIELRAEVGFKRLGVDAPGIFAAPLNPGAGRMEMEAVWTPRETRLARLELRSNEISLSLTGAVRPNGNQGAYVEAHLATPFLPLKTARKYLPLKYIQSPRVENWAAAVREGELKLRRAGIAGRLSEIRRIGEAGTEGRVWLDAELKDAAFDVTDGRYLPVRGVTGRLTLEKGALSFKGLKGTYGQSRLTEAEGSYRNLFSDQGDFAVRARGELDLAELKDQMKLGIFPPRAAELASKLQELGGKGKFGIVVTKTGKAPLQLQGTIALENARLRMDDLALSDLKGEFSFSPQEIRAEKASALLSGSPLSLRLVVRDYLSDDGTFDLAVDSSGVTAGAVTRLLLSTGSLQDPGTVRGSVRYYGALAPKGERKFTGKLDLTGVRLRPQPLKQPLQELTGKISIDDGGIDFQSLKGLLIGFPFDFKGRWRYAQNPQLLFTFAASELDIGYLISQIDEESGDWYNYLQAQGKVAINKGKFEGFEFSDLASDLNLDRRVWHLNRFSARSTGGTVQGVGTITDKPDRLGFNIEPLVQGVPVKGFFNWFDIGATEITGKVNLAGNLESTGENGAQRKRNLNGGFALRIEDGTVRRLRILVQILNLLDLSRWFTLKMPDINKEGIHFRSITGDFKVTQGVYSTRNLLVDSNDLRMTGAGEIDVPNDHIDFIVAVRPFPGVDTAINYIPLIGRGIAAIKNSLLVASFRVRGSIDDPAITPAPLSTLSEVFFGVLGIPKSLIGLSGEEKKNEKKEAPKSPQPSQEATP